MVKLALLICLSLLPLVRADYFDQCPNYLSDHIQAVAEAEAAKVVKPQVYFNAKLSQNYKPVPRQAIPYDVVISNIGDGYNSSTGYFTAPASGLYLFSVQTCSIEQYWNELAIVQMGNVTKSTPSKDGHCAYTSVPTYVAVGDQVWIERIDGGSTEDENGDDHWSGFTGVLLN